MLVGVAGVPRIDLLACDAGGLLTQAVGGEDLAVQDHVARPAVLGLLQSVVQVRCLLGERGDDLVDVAVPGCVRDTVVARERDIGRPAETIAVPALPAGSTSTPGSLSGCGVVAVPGEAVG